MTYYIYVENKKINGAGQARIINDDVYNFEITEGLYNSFIENPEMYIWDGSDVIINPNYEQEQAEKIRNELIEQVNYPLKAKVAYTGVRFDYEGQELVFETNETSISMINFTAMMSQQAGLTNISNWKCRKTVEPFEPVSVTFTMEQFQKLLTFATQMVLGAFAVEEQINEQIQALTVEQLNNPLVIEQTKQQMELAYSQIPVKLEGLFDTGDEGNIEL